MAQQGFGPMQQFVDDFTKPVDTITRWLGKAPAPSSKKVDPSWHAKEVDEANESFRKAAEKKASADPKLGGKKKTKPAAKKKAAVKKRG